MTIFHCYEILNSFHSNRKWLSRYNLSPLKLFKSNSLLTDYSTHLTRLELYKQSEHTNFNSFLCLKIMNYQFIVKYKYSKTSL